MSFSLILTSTWSSNDVQVKQSWSAAWIFAYWIKTWHALARLAPSAINDRLEKWSGRFGQNLQEVASISKKWNQKHEDMIVTWKYEKYYHNAKMLTNSKTCWNIGKLEKTLKNPNNIKHKKKIKKHLKLSKTWKLSKKYDYQKKI